MNLRSGLAFLSSNIIWHKIFMPFLEQDGIQFHYELTGEGPTVVLCHGLTGNLEQPKQLVESLPGYQLLLWDARGHGKTACVPQKQLVSRKGFNELFGLLQIAGQTMAQDHSRALSRQLVMKLNSVLFKKWHEDLV